MRKPERKKVSLLENALLFSVNKAGKVYPLFGVNPRDANNLFINYFTGDHLSIHADRKPHIKHLRDSKSKDMYEVEIEGWTGAKFCELLGMRGASTAWFDKRFLRPLSPAVSRMLDESQKIHHRIMMLDEYEKAGWNGGGLCISGVLISSTERVDTEKAKRILDETVPRPRDKEIVLIGSFYGKVLIQTVYDASMAPFTTSLGVGYRLNMVSNPPGGHLLLLRAFPKQGEDLIVENTGWEKQDESTSKV